MTLRELLAARRGGQGAVGGWCRVPSAVTVGVIASAGFDWVCIDLQHGAGGPHDLAALLPAIENARVPSVVRVGWNEPHGIMRALDAGASAVIVPMVNSRDDAIRAARAAHYAPSGMRSWGPLRPLPSGTPASSPSAANELVMCLAMIETAEAVEALDDILAVEGIDGAYVGPSDLAVSCGSAPHDSAAVEHLIEEVRARCDAAGAVAGIHCPDAAVARARLGAGFHLVAVANDTQLLRGAAAAALEHIHGAERVRS